MLSMMLSGWQIYDASPSLPFTFPGWMTLGGWLAGAIAWHLAAMWLLIADGAAYLLYGLATGHFRRVFGWLRIGELWHDLSLALRFRLVHQLGRYNAVQRVLYVLVGIAIMLTVVTGFAIWKPVQLDWLTSLFGGYPAARQIHLILMLAIAAFLVVHLTLVTLFPRTLLSMLTGLPVEAGEAPDETRA